MSETIGVGIIGLGFMGRTHLSAYRAAHAAGFPNRLVAISDCDPDRRSGVAGEGGNLETNSAEGRLFDPSEVRAYERPEELIADPDVNLVSICTPTCTHVDLGLRALEAHKHVLVEKPVALSAGEVRRLADGARGAGTLCLPAMCMRFWPGWSWLRERIVDGTFGRVRSAVFQRLACRPGWADFYSDNEETGGALFDLHVHDADFVRFCFGAPAEVLSTGNLDHVTTLYRFDRGPDHVVAEGGWDHADGFPFRMRFSVVFEKATADFDLGRDDVLLVARDGVCEPVEVGDLNGYDGEIRHLLAAIGAGESRLAATMDEAVELTEMLERERAGVVGKA